MPVAGRRPTDRITRGVVAGYVTLAAAPFLLAATHAWFWNHAHSTAPVAAVLVAALLIALVLRHGWAWCLLVAFEAVVLISFAFDFTTVPALLLSIASFALLISRQMRSYVRGG